MNVQAALSPGPIEIIHRYANAVPVDIDLIADKLGLRVHYRRDLGDTSGYIKKVEGGYEVGVNANHPETRRRFTLAHEVAHFVLHRFQIGDGITDDAMYRSELSDHFEREANGLAAAILMPANLVRSMYKAEKAIVRLAGLFRVSEGSMRIRLKTLGIGA